MILAISTVEHSYTLGSKSVWWRLSRVNLALEHLGSRKMMRPTVAHHLADDEVFEFDHHLAARRVMSKVAGCHERALFRIDSTF